MVLVFEASHFDQATAPVPVSAPLLLYGKPFTCIIFPEEVSPNALILPPPITNEPILTYHSLLIFADPVCIEPVQVPSS